MKIDKKDIIKFGNLEFLAKQVVEGFITGLHKSPFHGFSVEFAEHRLYNQGESTRHIDWKLLARTDKMFVKRYEEETNLRCQIVLDNSSSMYYGNGVLSKIQYAIIAAASIVEMMKKQRDAVGLHLFSDKINLSTPAKSSLAHHQYLIAELENILHAYNEQQSSQTEFSQNLHELADTLNRRSLILIFTDLLSNPEKETELFEALQHLKFNKHEVVLFHVTDAKTEKMFELDNRPYTLVDMETKEKIKLQPHQIKEKYQENIQRYFNEIRLKCISYKIDFVELDINKDLEIALVSYLNKRQFL
ncbi:MAG TPA: DUF58 domain-containing protein [Crocinitomicaceae bacterium]|nr:DUF58 domain-containing protein [Crocinitomicaceae bacterium]